MTDLNLSFPAMPDGADKNITKPSRQFKKSVNKVIVAIILFVIVYILLFLSAVAIAIAMGFLGVAIISAISNIVVMVLAIGLILSGLMLTFFLIKFIFITSPERKTGYEVTEAEQPELFAFIRKITDEVGTTSPRHIYLTTEVNASASFNPTIWSLFLPIRKDLNIGIGLVNGLNQSEFKAVLAHEFGHFSQRSMRFGGYVYHLNRALYNLLYENEGYHKALNAWGRWHYMLRFAAWINVYIIRCIQKILRRLYIFINKSYMQLSREMEFHADTIAAYASGANNVVSSLRRIEIADECLNRTFTVIRNNINEKKRTENMYELHSWLLKDYAVENRLSIDKYGLPVIDKKINSLNNSQVALNSQWYSHPLTEDRAKSVNKLGLNSTEIDDPAWMLFRNTGEIQRYFTDKLYEGVNTTEELAIVALEVIEADIRKAKSESSYNVLYNGVYDNRLITKFGIEEEVLLAENENVKELNDLLTEENCNLPKKMEALNLDIAKLGSLIGAKSDDIQSFDFRGVRYYPADAENIKEQLSAELKVSESALENLDKTIFRFFYNAASADELKKELIEHYEKVFKYQDEATIDFENYNRLMAALQPVYTQMIYSDIYNVVNHIYDLEREIKPRMANVIKETKTIPFISKEQQIVLDKYLDHKWVYFLDPKYDNNAIDVFKTALNTYIDVLIRRNFHFKNMLLDFQLSLY